MAETNGKATRSLVALTAGAAACVACIACIACGNRDTGKATAIDGGPARPDSYPVMLNKDLPFRYPPALYAEKVQGNVTLRLFVDKDGSVMEDSTRVVESSKIATLDSAAIKGSRELKFVPAKLRGNPVPVSILFPVYFRHPEAPPPAGDTLLTKVPMSKGDSASAVKKDTTGAKPEPKSGSKTTKRRHRSG